jgi:hypothetical protein
MRWAERVVSRTMTASSRSRSSSRRTAQQQLGAATDPGERRAQLVGGIGQEPTAALLSGLRLGQGGLQLQQCAVERLGHPPLLGDVPSHR